MKKLIFHLKFLIFFYAHSTNFSFAHTFDWIKISPQTSIEGLDSNLFPSDFSKEMAQMLLNQPSINSEEPITIFKLQNEILALFSCRFDVLRWSGTDWQNEYKGNFAGFNCSPHFFVKNDVLYSLGNQNSRETHSILLSFDFESGEWLHHAVENMPLDFRSDLAFQTSNLLMSIDLTDAKKSNIENSGYYLDFEERTWKNLKVKIPEQFYSNSNSAHFFELKDFALLFATSIPGKTNWLIVEKSKQTIHLPSQKSSLKSLDYSVVIAQQNRIKLLDQKGMSVLVDANEHFPKAKQIGGFYLDQPTKLAPTKLKNILAIILIIGSLVLTFLLWLRQRKGIKQITATHISTENLTELMSKYSLLSNFEGESLSVEKLDYLLGLEAISNIDSRRVARAKWIRSINSQSFDENGHELIVRTRSEEDNRIIIYSIHKNKKEDFIFK